MDHTETSHARRRKAPERERRQPLLTTSSMHEDPLAAPKRARSPPVGRKWRATLDEESIVDEILIKEIHERTIRDEARSMVSEHTSTIGAEYAPSRPLLKEVHDESSGRPKAGHSEWGSLLDANPSQSGMHPLAVAGHWPIKVGSEGVSAADLGLNCEIYLASDGTCTLLTSCWGAVDPDDPAEAARLLCNGRWVFEPWELPWWCTCCCPCVPRGYPATLLNSRVRISLDHGNESGIAVAQLPLRWSDLARQTIVGTLSYKAMSSAGGAGAAPPTAARRVPNAATGAAHEHQDGDRDLQLCVSFSIGDREWRFQRAQPPRWQDRCELAGLKPC